MVESMLEKANELQALTDKFWAIQRMPDGAPQKHNAERVLSQIKELSQDEWFEVMFRLAEDYTRDGRQLQWWQFGNSYKQRLKLAQKIYAETLNMRNSKRKREIVSRVKGLIAYLPDTTGPGLHTLRVALK